MPKQPAANRALTSIETKTLEKQVEKLVDAVSEDNWNAAQKTTVADLLENPVTALAFNSFLANVEKLKTAVPLTTQEDLAFLSSICKELNDAHREIRSDMFSLLNDLVGTRNKSKSGKVKIMHLLPEEMRDFAKDALRGMNDAGLQTKYNLGAQVHLVWIATLINSGWLAKVPNDLVAQIRSHQLLKAAGLKKTKAEAV